MRLRTCWAFALLGLFSACAESETAKDDGLMDVDASVGRAPTGRPRGEGGSKGDSPSKGNAGAPDDPMATGGEASNSDDDAADDDTGEADDDVEAPVSDDDAPPSGNAGASGSSNSDGGTSAAGGTSGFGGATSSGGSRPAPSVEDPVQPEGTVPMFVAVGHAGRTVVSCDAGRSWVGDRSDDPDRRCFDPNAGDIDCDHSSDAGTGIAYGNGWFVATFGWGYPGTIRRSRDGVNWEVVEQGNEQDSLTSSGLVWGSGRFLTGARFPRVGSDDAGDWTPAPELPFDEVWNVRSIGFAPLDGGTFILFGQDAERRLVTGTDTETWNLSDTGAEYCGGNNIVYGDGVLLMLGEASGCRSVDGGRTFEPLVPVSGARTPTLWTGDEFVYWGLSDDFQDTRYASDDGLEWEATPVTLNGQGLMRLGAVARSPDGTFVGVRGEWQQWYEEQRFYWSDDGVTWTEVPSGDYQGSHPLRQIVFGYGVPSEVCSAP